MRKNLSRRISRRRRRVYNASGPEQLETRTLLAADGVISGTVFYDTSSDGVQDAGEEGIPGVLVTLTGTTSNGDEVIRRYLTQADGSFRFEGLLDGTYSLEQTQPTGLADGMDVTDAAGVNALNDRYTNIQIANDNVVDGLNFGEGVVDAQFVSPIWLFASSGTEDFQREMRASMESDAGNDLFAIAILDGEEEVDSDFNLNGDPAAGGDSYSVDAGQQLVRTADDGVLANDTDPEGSALSATLVDTTTSGTLNLQSDGGFTYQPNEGFSGSDSFTYVATDGFRDSAITTVTITVTNPNTFEVSDSGAVENDSLGTVTSLTGLTQPAIFQFADEIGQAELALTPEDNILGANPESPALLIEYVDFACPACQQQHPTIESFKRNFTGELQIVQRYLPNRTPFNSIEAARAAEAAAQQDQFEALVDLLFDDANFNNWTNSETPNEDIEALFATIPGVDLDQFRTDRDSQATTDRIARDQASAAAVGAVATPTYFLNGEVLNLQTASLTSQVELGIADALLNPFKINRETGELFVSRPNRLNVDDTPVETFDVEIRNESQSETVSVTVNVNP